MIAYPAHLTALALAAACLLLLAPPASARRARNLWATVNVCDTEASAGKMGVRARMPGDATRERMYMRFSAQYRSGKHWKSVGGRSRSHWLYAGSALFRTQELGYTFSFDAPEPGDSFLMRGRVQFQWRDRRGRRGKRRTVVVRRAHRITRHGHRTKHADPPGFSAGRCSIRG